MHHAGRRRSARPKSAPLLPGLHGGDTLKTQDYPHDPRGRVVKNHVGGDGLILECVRAGGDKRRLTARCHDEALHTDVIDPASAKGRDKFLKALRAKSPDADLSTVEAELLRIGSAPVPVTDT